MLTSSGNNKKLGPGPHSDDVVTENRWSWRMFRSFINICSNVATFNTSSIKFWTQHQHTWPFYYFPGFLSIAPSGWTRSSSMGSIWITPWPSIMPRRLVLTSKTVHSFVFLSSPSLLSVWKSRLRADEGETDRPRLPSGDRKPEVQPELPSARTVVGQCSRKFAQSWRIRKYFVRVPREKIPQTVSLFISTISAIC